MIKKITIQVIIVLLKIITLQNLTHWILHLKISFHNNSYSHEKRPMAQSTRGKKIPREPLDFGITDPFYKYYNVSQTVAFTLRLENNDLRSNLSIFWDLFSLTRFASHILYHPLHCREAISFINTSHLSPSPPPHSRFHSSRTLSSTATFLIQSFAFLVFIWTEEINRLDSRLEDTAYWRRKMILFR